MLRSLPSAIDDALDTLYEPNAVFSQFLFTNRVCQYDIFFFFSFPCFLFLSCLFLFFLSCLFFPFLFCFSACLSFIPFPFSSFLFFVSFFSNWHVSVARVRSDRYYVQYRYIRGSLPWVASGYKSVFPGASSETYAPVWTWHIVGWLPISLLYVSGGGMDCVSCDMRVPPLACLCFSLGCVPQLQSDWSLSCDHGLDYAS